MCMYIRFIYDYNEKTSTTTIEYSYMAFPFWYCHVRSTHFFLKQLLLSRVWFRLGFIVYTYIYMPFNGGGGEPKLASLLPP